ncbi:hypothetical protein BF49_2427 [Bradyrhizobium sp.]|nr:hypothetical protein BF49_2427 [Bradyrhizobium sp.]
MLRSRGWRPPWSSAKATAHPLRYCCEHFPYDADVTKGLARPGSIFKAASGQAITTQSGWAAELVTTGVLGSLQIVAPVSVYSQLSQVPATIRVDLSGRAAVKVPSRAPDQPPHRH